jgi:hypothetical protein
LVPSSGFKNPKSYSRKYTNNREGGAGSRNAYRILVVELEESTELRPSGVLRGE